MKLLLDNIVFSLQRSGGISVYWTELLSRILQQQDVESFYLEYTGSEKNIFRKSLYIPEQKIDKKPLKLLTRYNNASKKGFEGIFHSSYYRNFHPKEKVKQVVTVHDFTYEKFNKGLKKYVHCTQKQQALYHANVIICVSENTRNDMFDLYPKTRKKEVHVVHNGVSTDFFPIDIPRPYPPFILFVGSRVEYKNFDFAVEVTRNLPENFQLVIVGQALSEKEKNFLERQLSGRYLLKSNVSNTELNQLYNTAFCLLYPSSYEGFGIPLIEAMSAGCPVITLDSSSIPEVCGDAGIVLDQLNIDEFRSAILSVEKDRNRLVQEGFRRSSCFSWEKNFEKTLKIYHSLL